MHLEVTPSRVFSSRIDLGKIVSSSVELSLVKDLVLYTGLVSFPDRWSSIDRDIDGGAY